MGADAARGAIDEKLRAQADNRGDDGFDTRLMREAADEIERLREIEKAASEALSKLRKGKASHAESLLEGAPWLFDGGSS